MRMQYLTGRTRPISEMHIRMSWQAIEFPWYDKKKEDADRYGKYGEIMPEEEFLLPGTGLRSCSR